MAEMNKMRLRAIVICSRCGQMFRGKYLPAREKTRDVYDDLEVALSGCVAGLGVEKRCPKCGQSVFVPPAGRIFIVYEDMN